MNLHLSQSDGFLRVAAASPKIRVADVEGNAEVALAAVRDAAERGVRALVLPELNLCGYTAADLFHNRTLLHACETALAHILDETRELPIVFTVGLPVAVAENIYNCAAMCCAGELLGLTAKKYLPNYGEFYERRWFAPAPADPVWVEFAGQGPVPLGSGLVYRCCDEGAEDMVLSVEVCEDLWVPAPPSTEMALAGATVILNPSASDEIIGKADYRRSLISNQSARLYCAYAYADASEGESTTDMVFAGENLIYENGSKLAATKLLTCDMVVADVDLDRLVAERRRSTTWTRADDVPEATIVEFSFEGVLAEEPVLRDACDIDRVFPRAPFVPVDHGDLAERCETILDLQTAGLKTRLAHTGTKAAVIGLSGGLDSTLALLVTVRAFDALGLPRTGITAVSMPGFGTTSRTRGNAEKLAEAYMAINSGVTVKVQQSDSSTGMTSAIEGLCDIGMASREVKDSEKEQGLDVTTICMDGIAVVVNNDNTVDNLSLEQVRQIFTGEVTNWKEVGGADAAITVINRASGSGTRATFEAAVLGDTKVPDTFKPQEQDSSGTAAKMVASTPGAISYLAFSYYDDTVKALKVGGVEPKEANVEDNSWTIWAYEHMYTAADPDETTKAFIDYMMSDDVQGELVEAQGYIPVSGMKVEKDASGKVTKK